MTSEYFFYHLFLSGVNQKYLSSSLSDFARNPLILLIHLLLSSIKIYNIINMLHIIQTRSPTGC
jgi:hypothetical protein